MDSVLRSLAEGDPNPQDEFTHVQLNNLLKKILPTSWADESIKLLLASVPDPVPLEQFIQFLFASSVAVQDQPSNFCGDDWVKAVETSRVQVVLGCAATEGASISEPKEPGTQSVQVAKDEMAIEASADFRAMPSTAWACLHGKFETSINAKCIGSPESEKVFTSGRRWQMSDFNLLSTVGTGSFGRVRLVKIKEGVDTTTPFALKILQKRKVMELHQVVHVKHEKDLLEQISHPFIVNFFTSFQDEKRLFMLLEYVNGGELFSLMRKHGRLAIGHARFYSGQIVLAFEYLHSLCIVYRDLKPENLLINSDGNIKITDFGFAKLLEERTWTLCGTPEYLAPEIIQSKGHGLPVDWWALGVLIFEMIAGFAPFEDENAFGVYQKILAGRVDFSPIPDGKAKDLIKRFLTMDRCKRLGRAQDGGSDVRRHKWYREVDWEMLASCKQDPPWKPTIQSDCTSLFDPYPESAEDSAAVVTAEEQLQFEAFG